MKKKVLALVLALTTVSGMIAGCGSSGSESAGSEQAAPAASQDAAQSGTDAQTGDVPTIRVAYNIMFPATDEQAIEDAVNKLLVEKAGAKIDLVGVEFANIQTQYNLMLTGGDNTVDLFNSFWYTTESNLVANGQVMELDDLIESEGQGIKEIYSGDMAQYLDCGRIGGKLYGIPCVYAFESENLFEVRKEDSDAAGIDWSKVTDLDSLTDAMVAMKKANPDHYYVPGSTDPYWVPKSIDYLGDTNYLGVLTDPTNSTTVENYYESEYFLDFLDHVKVWKENDLISPDPLSNTNPTLMNILAGVAQGTPGYSWDAQAGIESTSKQNNMEMIGSAVTDALATTGEVTTYMWHMSTFCTNPQAAMRVLNVMYTDPEVAQLLANGIEGLDYVLNADGKMEYPNENGLSGIGWGAASMAFWPNVTLCPSWSYEDDNVYDVMAEKRANAKKSKALGFQFDSTPVADQMTACANVVAQYYNPIMLGETDIDTALPEFQAALKTAGIDEIIAEKQKQLDAWLASK